MKLQKISNLSLSLSVSLCVRTWPRRMHNKTVLRDDDRWKRGEERPAQGKLRCWYIMEIRRGQSGYYVFLVIYIRFLSTSSSGHLRHRRNTGSKACGAQRRGRGPPSPLQTIPFSFPWTWTNTNTWDRFLSLSLSGRNGGGGAFLLTFLN